MRTPDGLADAIKHVHERLDELLVVTNFAPSRIAIGGFGMGGALAIAAGLSYRRPLAAILSHSGWMCQPAFELSAFGSMPHAAPNLETPIMLLAGDEDETVERSAVEAAGAALRAAGCQQVIFRSFEDTAHKFSLKSMGVMVDFLRARVPERPPAPKAGGENAGVGAKSRTMMLGNELGAAVASGQLQAAAEKAGLGPLPSGLTAGDRNQHAQAAKYELNLESADEISLVVHVPAGVTSMEQLELAISAEHVQVHVGTQPFLDLALPTPIDEDSARAKFAKKAGKLHISARRAVVGIVV
ncbi:hypothetical protein Ctob_001997 [Chrysochromulina tobinii]|uniref:Uncharacterized protein n=1 Tax=Chrysochromulina tobinii TaxID=1460289 RepID=A0A0M0JSR4_9EUKA|nr:hypothetical protein Ctob_001997 [Chrysochromulina tobinii]|eukprot:KOO29347.1 hypothetical protein Ctob_001997 [Chrysochromulina sp. CCMP291]